MQEAEAKDFGKVQEQCSPPPWIWLLGLFPPPPSVPHTDRTAVSSFSVEKKTFFTLANTPRLARPPEVLK